MALEFTIIILIGYFLGAVPSGLLIVKCVRGVDVREYGSGNIGFANVARTAGAKAGVATLILDVGKGTLAAWLGGVIVGGDHEAIARVVAALAAVAGHNWSIYLKFKGGRGVDTSLGGLLAMAPLVGLACLAILAPLVRWGDDPAEYLIYGVAVTILIVFQHRDNIARLYAGTERKIGQRGEKR
jgi:glycerol-3-phosphate acyltransferase PlsY